MLTRAGTAVVIVRGVKLGQFQIGPVSERTFIVSDKRSQLRRAPFVPSPADRRFHSEAGNSFAIVPAAPATRRDLPHELKRASELTPST